MAIGTSGTIGKNPSVSGGSSINSVSDIPDWPSGVSATDVGYLNNASGNIQSQIDGKAATSHTHPASAIDSGQVGLANGGTGADLSATGGTGQVLKQSSTGGAVSVGAISASDIPNLDASKITTGTIATARLASGTADSNSYLRGDNFWGGLNASHLESGVVPIERIYSPMPLRSASTSYDLIAVDSNTHGQIIIIDSEMSANLVTVIRIKAGVIVNIGSPGGEYVSGSPGATECQVAITGGYFRITTGSSFSRYVGISSAQVGRA